MQLHPEHCQYCQNVPTIDASRTIPLPHARRRAPTPFLHPTTVSLLLSISFTRFLTFIKQSEAAEDYTPSLFLGYLSLLLSMLSALSGALLIHPGSRTMYYDLPAFVVGPGWPTSTSIIQSQMNASMPDVPRRLLIPRWLYGRSWDFPSVCTFVSLACFTAQVWLYIGMCESYSVLIGSGFSVATVFTVAWRRLRTSYPSIQHTVD